MEILCDSGLSINWAFDKKNLKIKKKKKVAFINPISWNLNLLFGQEVKWSRPK